jgi:hypothetical protein
VRAESARKQDAAASREASGSPASGLASVRRRAPAREAWEQLAEPLRKKQGIRVLFFGITQYGKSTGVKDFLAYLQAEKLIELTIIHDIKLRRPQYRGEIIHEADALYSTPPEQYPTIRVLRKRDVDHVPSVEAAAKLCFEGAWDGTSTLLVVDEFHWALSEGGDRFEAPHVNRLFCEGGGMGGSIIATKQIPQHTPTAAIAQSKLVFFRQADKVLKFLVRQGTIDEKDTEVIGSLEIGEFVTLDAEDNFNGVVYEVPDPAHSRTPAPEEDVTE